MVQISNVDSRFSRLQVGDYVAKAGNYTKPGVIVEKKEDGTVVIDTDTETISRFHRHTNTSGLTIDDKDRFNAIMDDVMAADSNGDRINTLQATIDSLKTEPGTTKVVQTLQNQQAELIRLSRELPRVYQYEGEKLR
jgi:hypothetical protein